MTTTDTGALLAAHQREATREAGRLLARGECLRDAARKLLTAYDALHAAKRSGADIDRAIALTEDALRATLGGVPGDELTTNNRRT